MENQHVISINIWCPRYDNLHHPQLSLDYGLDFDFYGHKLCIKYWCFYGRLILRIPTNWWHVHVHDMILVLDLLVLLLPAWTLPTYCFRSISDPLWWWRIRWESFHSTLMEIYTSHSQNFRSCLLNHLKQLKFKFMGPYKVLRTVLSHHGDHMVPFLQDIVNPSVRCWIMLNALSYHIFCNLYWIWFLKVG